MNPSPDRSKECLPPKKRESRQGSSEQQQQQQCPPPDDFKPPVPLRGGRTGAGRGDVDGERPPITPSPSTHLVPSPSPAPPGPGVPLPLPWHLAYSPPVPLPLFPGQVGERRCSGSPSWREEPLPSHLHPPPRWLRGESHLALPPPAHTSSTPTATSSSSPSFKAPFPADSRDMWSFLAGGRRDYSSSLFSPTLFSQPPLYPPEPGHRYLGKRPNGLDGPGSGPGGRPNSACRLSLVADYGNESRGRLEVGPHSSHANGGRRQPEEPPAAAGGAFFPEPQAQEGPDTHFSPQDRDTRGIAKTSLYPTSPHRLGPDPRAGRGGLLDPLGGMPADTHLYYTPPSHHSPQAYPFYSPSGTPLYSLHREPGPLQAHNLTTPLPSPVGLPNSHKRTTLQERHTDRETERERSKGHRDRVKERELDKEREKDGERERRRERERKRERERGRELSPMRHSRLYSSPPAPLLPHFTKGSLIELASGQLKQVEELRTEDFLRSAEHSPEFHLSTCTVLLIGPGNAQGFNHLQVHLTDRNTQELLKVLVEYPFFVQDQGWSSCYPLRTTQLYGLPCRQLAEGDVCLALTPTPTPAHHTHTGRSGRAQRTSLPSRATSESGSSSHRGEMPPPPPPPPLPQPPPVPTAAARPPAPAPGTPAKVELRLRKRRWSAPDSLRPIKADEALLDLPHGAKQTKWQ